VARVAEGTVARRPQERDARAADRLELLERPPEAPAALLALEDLV
jgi:hypothetical protein